MKIGHVYENKYTKQLVLANGDICEDSIFFTGTVIQSNTIYGSDPVGFHCTRWRIVDYIDKGVYQKPSFFSRLFSK